MSTSDPADASAQVDRLAAAARGLAGPHLLAICTGGARPLFVSDAGQRTAVVSAIRKRALSTLTQPAAARIGPSGIDGDEQVDQTVHGGLDQAVYVYPIEHYAFWSSARVQAHRAEPLAAGALGENLLVSGLSEKTVRIGDHLTLGEVVLRVTRPRSPCFKFNAVMGFAWASKMMIQSGYTGFYCAVVRPGDLAAGRPIAVRPSDAGATIEELHRMHHRSPQGGLF